MGGKRERGEFLLEKQHAVDDIERRLLMKYLLNAEFNVTRAAKTAGMQRSAFQRMVARHGINVTILRREWRLRAEQQGAARSAGP